MTLFLCYNRKYKHQKGEEKMSIIDYEEEIQEEEREKERKILYEKETLEKIKLEKEKIKIEILKEIYTLVKDL